MGEFKRTDDYCEKTIKEVREIREMLKKCNERALVIPSTDSIIFYYQGKPFLSISSGERKWELFGTDYDKYFKDKSSEENGKKSSSEILRNLRNESNTNEEIKQIYEDNLDIILECIGEGMPDDKERASQQVIALNNISFEKDSYCICGFEAAIPESYFPDKKKPEIDLIAVNIEKKEILLIEYKCRRDALLTNVNNIGKHCEDYLTILDNEELCNDLKREILKAYNAIRRIYEEPELELKPEEFQINIAFLITKSPCVEKGGYKAGDITSKDLDEAKEKLDKSIEEYVKKREPNKDNKEQTQEQEKQKRHIKSLICNNPESCQLKDWRNFDDWHMGKISQIEMLSFAAEFAQAVAEINEELLEDVLLRFGNSILYLENAIGTSVKELVDYLDDADMSITEFSDDEDCEGVMVCEGFLYEKMYGYEATGEDIFGDGDEAKKLNKAIWEYTEKHGMWFEWSGGAVRLYAE